MRAMTSIARTIIPISTLAITLAAAPSPGQSGPRRLARLAREG